LDHGIQEIAIFDFAPVNREYKVGEVGFLSDSGDQRVDQVSYQRVNDGAKGRADYDGDRQIYYVATKNEITKTFQHRLAPLRVLAQSQTCYQFC
jgi:hypothetical protein